MGNFLSKYVHDAYHVVGARDRSTGEVLTGKALRKLCDSTGVRRQMVWEIMTPVEDRFPAQAYDLEMKRGASFSRGKLMKRVVMKEAGYV